MSSLPDSENSLRSTFMFLSSCWYAEKSLASLPSPFPCSSSFLGTSLVMRSSFWDLSLRRSTRAEPSSIWVVRASSPEDTLFSRSWCFASNHFLIFSWVPSRSFSSFRTLRMAFSRLPLSVERLFSSERSLPSSSSMPLDIDLVVRSKSEALTALSARDLFMWRFSSTLSLSKSTCSAVGHRAESS